MDTTSPLVIPNHHHDHPGFAGFGGLLCALTFLASPADRVRAALELTGAGPDDTVLDIGCGPGAFPRAAARRTGATVLAVDPAPVMLRVARALRRHPRVRYLQGTAEALPVDDGAATVAWSIATVHHWKDVDRGLAEARRALRPGGRFLALERHSPPGATGVASHGWTPAQAEAFADRLRAAGFTDVAVAERAGRRTALLSVLATRP